ncbi:hypothetical protein HOC35_02610 [Candidatus Woesearchaeota archaeon]|jgi:hypothetical protein|nr:hypothetical protein [Candidatus Woesearchaeota archaeon]
MFQKIKVWWALRNAKKIENQNMPNESGLKKEEAEFLYEAEELKKLINKPIKAKSSTTKAQVKTKSVKKNTKVKKTGSKTKTKKTTKKKTKTSKHTKKSKKTKKK